VELSADGRSAVVYRADEAPRTFEGLGAGSLLDLILSDRPSERRGALR
jgi:hypothetical protein